VRALAIAYLVVTAFTIRAEVGDSLASNELHHPELFRARAEAAVRGLTEPRGRVRAILEKVRASFPYKTGDNSILYFTWPDDLIDQKTGGVCDERAVMAVSWLRAVKIPARLVYLYFESGDHTCIEFYDGKRWVQADPESATVDDRRIYARWGRLLRVVIRHHPRDARKSARVHNLSDDPTDRKMNPEGDFLETEVDPIRWNHGETAREDPLLRRLRASAAQLDEASTSR
jgi:transglutaminase superfamily protein